MNNIRDRASEADHSKLYSEAVSKFAGINIEKYSTLSRIQGPDIRIVCVIFCRSGGKKGSTNKETYFKILYPRIRYSRFEAV